MTVITIRLVLGLLLLGLVQAKWNDVYFYSCDGCNCKSFRSIGDGSGASCIKIGSGAASIGMKALAGTGFECKAFTSSDCTGNPEKMGIKPAETWGCTTSQIGWINSVWCATTP